MNNTPKRPDVSQENIIAAAKKVAEELGCSYEPIADVFFQGYFSAFDMAKELEFQYYWDIDDNVMDALSSMDYYVYEEYEKDCQKWFVENEIKPPYEVGTMIKEGEITGIYQHGIAQYEVKFDDSNTRQLINFEDAEAV